MVSEKVKWKMKQVSFWIFNIFIQPKPALIVESSGLSFSANKNDFERNDEIFPLFFLFSFVVSVTKPRVILVVLDLKLVDFFGLRRVPRRLRYHQIQQHHLGVHPREAEPRRSIIYQKRLSFRTQYFLSFVTFGIFLFFIF